MNPERHLVTTADGSHSLYVPSLDEHYHSRHGAVQESQHVFMKMGWDAMPPGQPLRILEIGFGTGLNALLATLRAAQEGRNLHYTTVEAYPLSPDEAATLNFAELILHPDAASILDALHQSPWGAALPITHHTTLLKLHARIEDFSPVEPVHLIFFDAFAPDKQPELWTEDVFRRMKAQLLPGGLLVTYCAKGAVKRAMKAAGLRVEKVAGPPGKREMLRAWG